MARKKKNKNPKKHFGEKKSALRKAYKSAVKDKKLTTKEVKKLSRKGASKKAIKKLIKRPDLNIAKKVITPKKANAVRTNTNRKQFVKKTAARLNLSIKQKKALNKSLKNDKGKPKITKKDVRNLAKAGVSKSQLLKISKRAAKTPSVSTAKKVDKAKINKIVRNQKQDKRQAAATAANKAQDKINVNTKEPGSGRVEPGKVGDKVVISDDGIAYKTHGKGDNLKTLSIGNLPGHRYDDSQHAGIKIVDYDASIENYDPSKSISNLGIVKKNVYDKNLNIKGVKFEKFKPKRQKYHADKFRSDEQKEDYAGRGLTKEGGQITGYKGEQYKKTGKYDKVLTDKDGTLKRLTLTDNNEYKPTNDKYPTEVKSDSFSDLLTTQTGLTSSTTTKEKRMQNIKSMLRSSPSKYKKTNRDGYIASGKTQLGIN